MGGAARLDDHIALLKALALGWHSADGNASQKSGVSV